MNFGIAAGFHELGTGAGMVSGNAIGNLPVRNWSDGQFDDAAMIQADVLRDSYRVAMEACPACQIRCKKVVELENDPTRWTAGTAAPSTKPSPRLARSWASTISRPSAGRTSCVPLFAGHDFSRRHHRLRHGVLREGDTDALEDTGGIDLRFGNADAMLKVIELIAHRQGIGDILADGSRAAAQRIGRGAEELSMQVKGVEFGMHEPRLKQGLGLIYSIAAQGADHMAGAHDTFFMQEGRGMEAVRSLDSLDPLPADDLSTAKVDRVKNLHLLRNFSDSLVTCNFVPWTLRQQVEMLRALTGWDYTDFEALRQGERVATMARVFNLREGLTAADDQLPQTVLLAHSPRGVERHRHRSRSNASGEADVLHPHGLGPDHRCSHAGEAGTAGHCLGRRGSRLIVVHLVA